MNIAITGATGFLGRYIVARLAGAGHHLTCWYRSTSDLAHFPAPIPKGAIHWIEGGLGDESAARRLVDEADAVVHAALDRPGPGFVGQEGELVPFVDKNVLGTLRLIEAARSARVDRFVFISSCAVYDRILPDRPLDETHPLWAGSHYGAHKAAIEAFVHSFGFGHGFPICALRPTGIYGLAHPPRATKWFDMIARIVEGRPVECQRGGKEVHAADVARAVEILLQADPAVIAGQAYNCCDRYVSEKEVATIAQRLSSSGATIKGEEAHPKNQIATNKIQGLGMNFGGIPLLEETIGQIIAACRRK